MTVANKTNESQSTILCKSCGLCCTGHLFIWTRLNAAELNPSQALGLNVIRSDPRQRGFTQPCPLWQGICTIYTDPHYPRSCRSYKCKLLKDISDGNISFSKSLAVVQQAKTMIRELEALLPVSPNNNFRERLVAHMENGGADPKIRLMADNLLVFIEEHFGVNDFLDKHEEGWA